MINDKQIEYLHRVARKQSVTAAAAELYVSQPALSRMILAVEESLGAPLFLREKGRMTLTRAGEIYLDTALQMQAQYQAMRSRIAEEVRGELRPIRFGLPPICANVLLPALLPRFRRACPQGKLLLQENRNSALARALMDGEIDMAVLYEQDVEEYAAELAVQELMSERLTLQVPPALAQQVEGASISAEQLRGQPFVLLKPGRGLRKWADRLFSHFGLHPTVVLETESIDVTHAMTLAGEGISFMSKLAKAYYGAQDKGAYREVAGYPMERRLCIVHRRDFYRNEAAKRLVEECRSLCGAIPE